MKLFKKLKTKANKTLQDLKQQYEIVQKDIFFKDHQDKEVNDLVFVLSQDTTIETTESSTAENEEVVEVITDQQFVKIEDECQQDDAQEEAIEETAPDLIIQTMDEKAKNVSYIELLDGDYKINVEALEYLDDLESEIIVDQLDIKKTNKTQTNNEQSCDFMPDDSEEIMSEEDETPPPPSTDIDNFDAQNGYVEVLDDTSQETTANTEDNIFLDVHYLETLNDKEEKFENKYYCNTCDILFYKKTDFQKHR